MDEPSVLEGLAELRVKMARRDRARFAYVTDPRATEESVAQIAGVDLDTVRAWAEAGEWGRVRREHQASQAVAVAVAPAQASMPGAQAPARHVPPPRSIMPTKALLEHVRYLERSATRLQGVEFAITTRIESVGMRTGEYRKRVEQSRASNGAVPMPPLEDLPDVEELRELVKTMREFDQMVADLNTNRSTLEHVQEVLGAQGIELPSKP